MFKAERSVRLPPLPARNTKSTITRHMTVAVMVLWSMLYGAPGLHAAQPYTTDDARLLDKGVCQLEAGKQENRDNREFWLLPACNPTGNLELTLGLSRFVEPDGNRHQYVFQGKGLFRKMDGGNPGLGWVAGVRGHGTTAENRQRISNVYGSFLYSQPFLDERLVVHLNAGALHDRDQSRDLATWGTAMEFALNERFTLIGEFFGDSRTRPSNHAGIRVSLVPDRVEMEISAGGQNGNHASTRWWTIGVRLITPPFLR